MYEETEVVKFRLRTNQRQLATTREALDHLQLENERIVNELKELEASFKEALAEAEGDSPESAEEPALAEGPTAPVEDPNAEERSEEGEPASTISKARNLEEQLARNRARAEADKRQKVSVENRGYEMVRLDPKSQVGRIHKILESEGCATTVEIQAVFSESFGGSLDEKGIRNQLNHLVQREYATKEKDMYLFRSRFGIPRAELPPSKKAMRQVKGAISSKSWTDNVVSVKSLSELTAVSDTVVKKSLYHLAKSGVVKYLSGSEWLVLRP
jgi:DNA-binding GntR family transcriptional regulator